MRKTSLFLLCLILTTPALACNTLSPAVELTPTSPLPPTPPPATATPLPTSTPSATNTPAPTTVVVADDGSGDYKTLPEAVAAVAAGSTIILEAGTFTLDRMLIVDKDLTLKGSGMDETFVAGNGEEAVVRFAGPGRFDVEGITFRYDGGSWANVVVVTDGDVDIYRCGFTGGIFDAEASKGGSGVLFFGHSTVEVARCSVDGRIVDGAFPRQRCRSDTTSRREAAANPVERPHLAGYRWSLRKHARTTRACHVLGPEGVL